MRGELLRQPALQHGYALRSVLQPRPASANWHVCSGWPATPGVFLATGGSGASARMAKTASSLTVTKSSRLAADQQSASPVSWRPHTLPRFRSKASPRLSLAQIQDHRVPELLQRQVSVRSQMQLHPRASGKFLQPQRSVPSRPPAARTSVARGALNALLVLLPVDTDRAPDARRDSVAVGTDPRRPTFHASTSCASQHG